MIDVIKKMFRPCDRDNPPSWVIEARAERAAELEAEIAAENAAAVKSKLIVLGNQLASAEV